VQEDFAGLQRAMEALEVERLRRLAELDRRKPFVRDGHLSTSSWLAHAFRVSGGAASGDVRLARALDAMPETRRAVACGEISWSAARVLVSARSKRSTDVRDEALRERRRLHVSPTVFGMVRIDGDLDAETGEPVLTALTAFLDAEARSAGSEDTRIPAQRRADAMAEICRQWLDSTDRPDVAGERPHINVTVDLEALRGAGARPCHMDHVGPVDGETARQLACDAMVSRIVTTGRSEPLDVGRQTPLIPAAIRRALVVRDRHCRFPGCDRPPPWCDGHHVQHWADGGPTALTNLVLLCRRHHRMIHRGFSVNMKGGKPLFRRPDGTQLPERPGARAGPSSNVA
jgi:uncharacterized protein DUF222/HNH endonuclease